MENLGKWKLIKIGFLLGIGFIIPQIVTMYAGTAGMAWMLPKMMESSAEDSVESFSAMYDKAGQIEIDEYRESKNGNQLLILGTITNAGEDQVSSVQLEAELKDAEGKMVYECSEYISRDMKSGDKENFQIKCGCGKNPVPDYASVDVRVVKASVY